MKKKSVSFALALAALLIAGVGARFWQRGTAFEPETGLLKAGMPATYCLVALVALGAAALFWLGRRVGRETSFSGYLSAFASPARGMNLLYLLSGALLVAGGVLGIMDYRLGLNERLGWGIFGGCMCLAGVGVVLIGWLNAAKREAAGRFAWPLLLPGYCGCAWLIVCYQDRASEPNLMAHVFYLLGAVCAVVCCYLIASFSFEKPQVALTLWLGGVAVLCLFVSAIADLPAEGRRMETLVSLGYALYLMLQMAALLKHCVVPAQLERWTPPPSEEESNEAKQEVTEE